MRREINPAGCKTIRLYQGAGPALNFARGGLATLAAAETVRRLGRKGDEVLIHINPKEFRHLIKLWGEPSVNPYSGLPEYGFVSKAFKKVKKTVKSVQKHVKQDIKNDLSHSNKDLKSIVRSPVFRAVAPIVLNLLVPGLGVAVGTALGATGAAAGVIGGAVVQGAIGAATGGTKGAVAGALTGGLGGSGGVLSQAAGSYLGTGAAASNTISAALLGGASSKIQGGSFGKGALTGGALAAATPYLKNAVLGTNDATLTSGLGESSGPLGGGAGADVQDVGNGEVGPPAPSTPAGPPAPGALDFSQGPPSSLAGAGQESSFETFDPSSIPAPEAPQVRGFLDNALDYAKQNPLKVGLGALTLANGLGRSAPQSNAPQAPQVPLPQSFFRPVPNVPFNRKQTVAPVGSYYNYGMMPEQMWYQNNQTPPPPNDDEDEEDRGFAMGGLSALHQGGGGVGGTGTGRSDEIDAKLSDGEYVMDAETVSMLGDGSSKAGAEKLDEMRAMIRRHKAKNLSKGKMSPNARHPSQYLSMG